MENKKDVKEQANPIFNTAKYTLYNLSRSGVEEAGKYLDALGFDEEQAAAYGNTGDSQKDMEIPNYIIQESRYTCVNRVIEEKGIKNVFDLACGFSPRGYALSKKGYKYIGADLPATVELVEPVAKKVMDADCKIPVEYRALDLTNPASVVEAAKAFDGEICISAEGLLIYFDILETEQFIEGIRAVLKEHGGCFVTPDYASGAFYTTVVMTIYGPERGMQLIMETTGALEKTSDAGLQDTETHKSLLHGTDDSYAVEFFEKKGFKVERVPFYDPKQNLVSMEGVDTETAAKIKAALNNIMVWVVTLDENYKEESADASHPANGKTTMQLSGDILKVNFAGRVDSISAPDLISEFEDLLAKNTIRAVDADMKDLQYISSAGLRFILMMKKSVADKTVSVKNVNEEVMSILEMTGFTQIVDF